MKNSGFLKLGFKNILAHKFFSIFVVITLGIIFGISMATTIHTISNNVEKFSEESAVMDGKVLAKINVCDSDYLSGGCDVPEKYDEEVLKVAKKYGGETIGAKITYANNQNEKVYVILERAGKYLNHGKFYSTVDGKIPIVKKADEKIDENIYQILKEYSNDETPFYILMDDTMTVMNFLFANGFQMLTYEPLVIFDDENMAYDFYKSESKENFEFNQIFNKSISAKENYIKSIYSAIITFLAIFGITILILIIFEVVTAKKDKKNIRLYRTFGATKKDIFRIYLLSGIELFILSILISPIIYLITALIISRS